MGRAITSEATDFSRNRIRTAVRALKKIRDGQEVRRPDGSTEMVDLDPGEAAGIARNALKLMGITDDH